MRKCAHDGALGSSGDGVALARGRRNTRGGVARLSTERGARSVESATPSAVTPRTQKVALLVVAALVAAGGVYAWRTTNLSAPLSVGDSPPRLSATAGDGTVHTLAELEGRPVVVFFYPRDETPGCTAEVCAFRDVWDRFERAGVAVLGVSTGSVEGKRAFATKHELPFPLLADSDLTWAKAFGVRVVLDVPERVTFLLDRQGKVAKVYPKVDPGVHAEQVLADAAALPP